MRIKENFHEGHEGYTSELKERVIKIYHYTTHMTEVKRLLKGIKQEAECLRQLFWTDEELKERNDVERFFEARMQATVYYTLKNIEGYQQYGWKQLIEEGE
ncbi:hypothetical protein BKP37_05955 [Anaerobacillus alkalilacustris]|uniref:Uncharacterized protein n=1 Tax=Anaerobacillus alkalilacustris TaxID=393763 RepID=A0A1S2LWQ4_9BACI|nr:hypothetical protein [Anaerobacillus alkalilacustris]OIJ16766.1 hypothetical protein BKP37_05955 [Anaerobacillus alkalilacustris]